MKKALGYVSGILLTLCMFLFFFGDYSVKAAGLPSRLDAPKDVNVDFNYENYRSLKVIYSINPEAQKLLSLEGVAGYAQIDWKFSEDDDWKYSPSWDEGKNAVENVYPLWEKISEYLSDNEETSNAELFYFYDKEDSYWSDTETGWSLVVPETYLNTLEVDGESYTGIDWNRIGVDVRVRYFLYAEKYNEETYEYEYDYLVSDWSDVVSYGNYSADYDDIDNLLVNPDFEEGLKGWKDPDKCWQPVFQSDVGKSRHGRILVWPITGGEVVQGDGKGEKTRIYQDVDISAYKPDETVVFRTFICNFNQAPHDMGKIVLTFLDKDGNAVVNKDGKKETYTQSQRNPNWNTQTIICSIPEGAVTVRVNLYACRYVGWDIDAYYDFCSLVVKPEKVYPVTVTEKNNKSKVKQGDEIQLFASNTKTNKASDFVWSSSYNTAATVDENGLVTFHTDAEDGMAIYATDKESGVTGVYWFNSDEENAKYSDTSTGSGKTDSSTDTGSTGSGKTDSSTDTGSTGSGKTDSSTDTGSTGSGKTDSSTDTGSTGSGKTDSSSGSGSTSSKAPKAAKISKLVAGSKSFTIKWKKVSGVKGYEIRYSTKKSMSSYKAVTVSKASTVKKAIKKLSGGKKYYVQIRTYTVVNGKKVYSDWSKLKSVKTKK